MNKLFVIFIFSFFLMSCSHSLVLINSVKQTVIPGRPNQEIFTNYLVEFSLEKDANIVVDSVKVFDGKKSYLSDFTLKKKNSASFIKRLNEKGTYTIGASLQEKRILRTDDLEQAEQNKLVVFYSVDNEPQELMVSEFKMETQTRR